MQMYFTPIMMHALVLLWKKIPFVLFLLLPRFAQTVQVSTQFFMIRRTAACVLTAVLSMYLLPDSFDFAFIAGGFSTWHRAKETDSDNDEILGATLQDHCGAAFQQFSSCSQDCEAVQPDTAG